MNILRIKTDASSKDGVGFTLAYECKVQESGTTIKTFEDSTFCKGEVKSTQAELLGVVYATTQSFKSFKGNPEEFQIAIESDCEYAVNSLNNRKIKSDKIKRTVYPLLNKFSCWRISWIPRHLNKRTNDLARERLRRAEDGL